MRGVKKSRTGCARCKSKRVKCGEETPACNRCTRLGVRCPGYVQPLRWVTSSRHYGGAEDVSGRRESFAGRSTLTRSPTPPPVAAEEPVVEAISAQSFPAALPASPAPLALDASNTNTSPELPFDVDGVSTFCDNLWDPRKSVKQSRHCAAAAAAAAAAAPNDFFTRTQCNEVGLEFDAAESSTTEYSRYLRLLNSMRLDQDRQSGLWPQQQREKVEWQKEKQAHADGHESVSRIPGFSPAAIVRSYPAVSFQPETSRPRLSIHQPLNSPSWSLIEYYFKEVAALFSSYDGQMNPFRTTVSRLWSSSMAMCRTMQSMAAASLVHDFPHFGPIGLKMRKEAVDMIASEAVMDDKSLLALLMLGQTASWHDPKDLGVSFFNILRRHLNDVSSGNKHALAKSSNNHRFFEEALVYWEMLLSFVADNDAVALSGTTSLFATTGGNHNSHHHTNNNASYEEVGGGGMSATALQRVPHPWTGIARDTQYTVQEVGRLVRQERKRMRQRRFSSHEDIVQAQKAIERAQELEERLLGLAHPAETEIVSPGDDDTPVWHLLTMGEVYRCTGLIQLYRIFPDLLRRRLPFPPSGGGHMFDIRLSTMHGGSAGDSSSSVDAHFPPTEEPSFAGHMAGSVFDSIAGDNIAGLEAGFTNEPRTSSRIADRKTNSKDAFIINNSDSDSDSDNSKVNQGDDENTACRADPRSFYDDWLTTFALATLSRLKAIPIESRTRCLQPFLLVASCSELRLPRSATNLTDTNTATGEDADVDTASPGLNVSSHAIQVSRTRQFILGRLSSFVHVLPPKPIYVCLELVQEVWRRMDAGEEGIYWMDVMMEKGWETTMG